MQSRSFWHCEDDYQLKSTLLNLAVQFEGHKCETKITKSSSCISTLVFHGWFKPIVNKEDMFKIMWFFFPNDMDWCVLGNLWDFVKGKF